MGFLFDPVELKPKIIRVSGATKDAIETYRNLKIPLSRLISDYYIVKANRSLVKKNNPWIYYHKGILKKQYEVGASVIEDAFNQAAVELVAKKKEPTDVINAAFYSNKNRNDSAFELSFLLPLFFENTAPADRILVVNPSPDVIRFAEETHTGEKSYLVTDETIANLYKMEFPESEFFAFDQFGQVRDVDRMLVINRDQEKEHDSLLLSGLQCCNDNAAVLLCVPSVWFDSSETAFSAIQKNGFSIETIVILDTAATASTPRKKILVQLDRDSHSKISLYMSHYDKASKVFSVCPQGKTIYTEQFAKKKKSILSLWNQDVEKQKEPRIKQTKQYFFSREISLFYGPELHFLGFFAADAACLADRVFLETVEPGGVIHDRVQLIIYGFQIRRGIRFPGFGICHREQFVLPLDDIRYRDVNDSLFPEERQKLCFKDIVLIRLRADTDPGVAVFLIELHKFPERHIHVSCNMQLEFCLILFGLPLCLKSAFGRPLGYAFPILIRELYTPSSVCFVFISCHSIRPPFTRPESH